MTTVNLIGNITYDIIKIDNQSPFYMWGAIANLIPIFNIFDIPTRSICPISYDDQDSIYNELIDKTEIIGPLVKYTPTVWIEIDTIKQTKKSKISNINPMKSIPSFQWKDWNHFVYLDNVKPSIDALRALTENSQTTTADFAGEEFNTKYLEWIDRIITDFNGIHPLLQKTDIESNFTIRCENSTWEDGIEHFVPIKKQQINPLGAGDIFAALYITNEILQKEWSILDIHKLTTKALTIRRRAEMLWSYEGLLDAT